MTENCAVCGCKLTRVPNTYAKPTIEGRSHATKHHYVAERFFGRTANRKGEQRTPIFERCPWNQERETALFCYECHEELLHNPVFLPDDIEKFAGIVQQRGLNESKKTNSRDKLGERIMLFHEIIEKGINVLMKG